MMDKERTSANMRRYNALQIIAFALLGLILLPFVYLKQRFRGKR